MNFLVAQIISCYNPFETKERNLIKIYSFEKGIHMKAISKMKSLILKYRHAWVLLYGLIYMPWFCYLEKRQTIHYLIHSPLDDYIPFVEYFIIPYLLWFVFLAVTGAYFFFTNRRDFYRLAAFLCSGMTIFLIVCTIFPNGLNLRPVTFPRENIFTDLVRMIYSMDTPTNVLPSIHVYNSIGAMAAIAHSTSLKKHRGVQIGSLCTWNFDYFLYSIFETAFHHRCDCCTRNGMYDLSICICNAGKERDKTFTAIDLIFG